MEGCCREMDVAGATGFADVTTPLSAAGLPLATASINPRCWTPGRWREGAGDGPRIWHLTYDAVLFSSPLFLRGPPLQVLLTESFPALPYPLHPSV